MTGSRLAPTDNERGMAIVEAVPLLVIFLMFASFGLGLFGAIHTSILYSIGARTYAFETFRNRTDLTYFRTEGSGLTQPLQNREFEMRFHAINSEAAPDIQHFYATTRPISVGRTVANTDARVSDHNEAIFSLGPRNQSVAINPIWIMVGYGICLNARCGD